VIHFAPQTVQSPPDIGEPLGRPPSLVTDDTLALPKINEIVLVLDFSGLGYFYRHSTIPDHDPVLLNPG